MGLGLGGSVACGRAAAASPLTLTWSVFHEWDGNYRYTFTLTLDNHDGTWQPGQGFGWVIFSDGGPSASPLGDFTVDSYCFPIGPWTEFTKTAGRNNGPTLAFGRRVWKPMQVGDSLTWSGTSAVRATEDDVFWTSLITAGGAKQIEHERSVEVASCGPADINNDGFLDGIDFELFMTSFEAGTQLADLNHDGFIDGLDYETFMLAFDGGC